MQSRASLESIPLHFHFFGKPSTSPSAGGIVSCCIILKPPADGDVLGFIPTGIKEVDTMGRGVGTSSEDYFSFCVQMQWWQH